jgi:hypothetical protein
MRSKASLLVNLNEPLRDLLGMLGRTFVEPLRGPSKAGPGLVQGPDDGSDSRFRDRLIDPGKGLELGVGFESLFALGSSEPHFRWVTSVVD